MPDSSSQAFLRELDKKLWTAADKRGGGLHPPSPSKTWLLKERGRPAHSSKIISLGRLIENALEAVEKENPMLKAKAASPTLAA